MAIRLWSMKQILYVVIMPILIMSSSLAAFLFIRHNKITLELYQQVWAWWLLFSYICSGFFAPGAPGDSGFFVVECVSHFLGLGLVVVLLHSISPVLALCVGILCHVVYCLLLLL